MKPAEAAKLVAVIRAAFPREQLEEGTPAMYARFLVDLDFAPAETAVGRVICRSRFFPSIAELRAEVAEVALGLPGELEAFRLAEAHASWRGSDAPCGAPGCADGFTDEQLERPCPACRGTGRVHVRPDPLPGPVAEAYRYVGGRHGFLAGEPGVVRAHFRDAYRQARAAALESLSAPGLPAGRRREIAA